MSSASVDREGVSTSRALKVYQPRDAAAFRLFCFPYAGAGASVFSRWGSRMPSVEVVAVQYPGRETRIQETPRRRLDVLADELAHVLAVAIQEDGDRPFALFGHSLGALVALEVAARLESRFALSPRRLFLSGRRPPHLPLARPKTLGLDDDAFIEHLRQLGGTPPAVLVNSELMELLLPVLRADFELFETHEAPDRAPLRSAVTALAGDADPDVGAEHLREWASYASGGFDLRLFRGGHFYLAEQAAALCRLIETSVAESG